MRLMMRCACIIGNSSSAIREGTIIGTPAVNVGTRQSSRERGKNVIDVEHDQKQIIEAIRHQIHAGRYPPEYVYGDGHAGARIAEVLANCPIHVQKRFFS